MSEGISKKAAIEAMIFASRQGITSKKMARILELKENQLLLILEELQEEYAKDPNRGVILRQVNGKFRFYTKKEVQKYVTEVIRRPIARITDSQLEVLAIVAIRGPVTRNDVELMRGKSSQSQLLELQKMGLLRKRRSKLPGRPYLYKVTQKFYDTFQLNDLSEIVEGLEGKIVETKEVNPSETSEVSSDQQPPVETESGGSDKE